jgi:hypothetical protein
VAVETLRGRGRVDAGSSGLGRAWRRHRDRRAVDRALRNRQRGRARSDRRAAAGAFRRSDSGRGGRARAGRPAARMSPDRGAGRRGRRRSHCRAQGPLGRAAADSSRVRGLADPSFPGRLPRFRGSRAAADAGAGGGGPSADAGLGRAARGLRDSAQELVRWRGCGATPRCCASTARPTRRPPIGSNARSPRSRRKSRSRSRCVSGRSRTTCAGCTRCAGRSRRWPRPSRSRSRPAIARCRKSAPRSKAGRRCRQRRTARGPDALSARCRPRVQELRDADERQRWAPRCGKSWRRR